MRTRMNDRRAGFTLIELLIVVVIIGILAAIALPRLASTREAAYFSTLQGDLRSLSKAMEIWYMNNGFTYIGVGTDGAELRSAASWGATEPVEVNIVVSPGGQGWSASAEHPAIIDAVSRRCAMFVGDAAPQEPATVDDEGIIVCSQ